MSSTWNITVEGATLHDVIKAMGIEGRCERPFITDPGKMRVSVEDWQDWKPDMARVSERVPNSTLTVIRTGEGLDDFEKAVFSGGSYKSANGRVKFGQLKKRRLPRTPVYKPVKDLCRVDGVRYRIAVPRARLVNLLGAMRHYRFSGQRGEDTITVWRDRDSAQTVDEPAWNVWANSHEAWRRFEDALKCL